MVSLVSLADALAFVRAPSVPQPTPLELVARFQRGGGFPTTVDKGAGAARVVRPAVGGAGAGAGVVCESGVCAAWGGAARGGC